MNFASLNTRTVKRKFRYHPNANGVGPLSENSSTCQGTARYSQYILSITLCRYLSNYEL